MSGHNSMFETPTRNPTSRFNSREGADGGARASPISNTMSPSQRLKDLFFATYTSGIDPQTSQRSSSSFLTSSVLQTPAKKPSSSAKPADQDDLMGEADDSMDIDVPAANNTQSAAKDMLADAPMTEDDLKGPAVPLAINTTGRFYSEHMRRCELRIELMGLSTLGHMPRGVYVMPSLKSINVWYGVMFIKRGYWRDAVVRFRIDIPREYPRTHPIITLATSVVHPLVRQDDGKFALEQQFPQWTPYSDYIFHALHYLKNSFKNRVLKQLQPQDCHNVGAYMKFKNDLPHFREYARVDAMKSRTPEILYRPPPGDCPIVFSLLSNEDYNLTMQQIKSYANNLK